MGAVFFVWGNVYLIPPGLPFIKKGGTTPSSSPLRRGRVETVSTMTPVYCVKYVSGLQSDMPPLFKGRLGGVEKFVNSSILF